MGADHLRVRPALALRLALAGVAIVALVYPTAAGQDCGVGAPMTEGRPYGGPCKVGWVNAGWVTRD